MDKKITKKIIFKGMFKYKKNFRKNRYFCMCLIGMGQLSQAMSMSIPVVLRKLAELLNTLKMDLVDSM